MGPSCCRLPTSVLGFHIQDSSGSCIDFSGHALGHSVEMAYLKLLLVSEGET